MTNAQILTAVLLKWGEPVIPALMSKTLAGVSATMLPVEKFLKSVGMVGGGWSMAGEINSLAAIGGTKVIRPYLERLVSKMPDELIPEIAHGYVSSAIEAGSLSILDNYFSFDRNDLVELKKYLDCNLPYQKPEEYVVKVPQAQPQPQAQNAPKNEQRDKDDK